MTEVILKDNKMPPNTIQLEKCALFEYYEIIIGISTWLPGHVVVQLTNKSFYNIIDKTWVNGNDTGSITKEYLKMLVRPIKKLQVEILE